MDSVDMSKTNIRIDIPIMKTPRKRQLSSAVGRAPSRPHHAGLNCAEPGVSAVAAAPGGQYNAAHFSRGPAASWQSPVF